MIHNMSHLRYITLLTLCACAPCPDGTILPLWSAEPCPPPDTPEDVGSSSGEEGSSGSPELSDALSPCTLIDNWHRGNEYVPFPDKHLSNYFPAFPGTLLTEGPNDIGILDNTLVWNPAGMGGDGPSLGWEWVNPGVVYDESTINFDPSGILPTPDSSYQWGINLPLYDPVDPEVYGVAAFIIVVSSGPQGYMNWGGDWEVAHVPWPELESEGLELWATYHSMWDYELQFASGWRFDAPGRLVRGRAYSTGVEAGPIVELRTAPAAPFAGFCIFDENEEAADDTQ